MTVIKNPKKKYLKLLTLGKKFSSKTFSDNTKKLILNALALFVVVTFTFYVESVGDNYENRQKYLDISKKILDELYLVSGYTDTYISQTNNLLPMYKNKLTDGTTIMTAYLLIILKTRMRQMVNIIMHL